MRNLTFHVVVITLVVTVSMTVAHPISPKLESILQHLGDDDEVSVIISLSERVDLNTFRNEKGHILRANLIKALKRKAHLTQKPLSLFLNKNGVRNIKRLWLINSMAFTANAAAIDRLRDRVEIASVRLDYTLHLPETIYTSASQPEWNLNIIDAPELWNLGFTGGSIVVASMDTGVDFDHPDANSQWRGGENSWYDPHGEHEIPYDNDGHGTQTMGIMIGGDAGGTAIGVAPDANWIAVKIFDDAGDTQLSDIHLGFQWLLDPDGDPNTDDAPDIVNNSWGMRDNVNECVLEFYDDIQALKTAGIAVVFSAGNEGPVASTSVSPANYDNSFAVSSVDSANTIDLSSSRGPSPCSAQLFPTVVAPGVNIKAPDLTFGGAFLNSYAYVSGTSFAAPHISGAMALLMEAFPTLSPAELEDALTLSAEDLGPAGADYDYGHGLINLAAAYELLESSFCSGDFNHDESVDLLDLEVLTVEWLGTNCTNCWSDLNGDQKVDFYDFSEFANHYKQPDCP